MRLVTLCHHTNIDNFVIKIDNIPHTVHFILMTHFIVGSLDLLISLTYFTYPATFLPSGTIKIILYIYDSVSKWFVHFLRL